MFTSIGFNPHPQTINAVDHAFPVKAKGWGVQHWDCDLIWDDEFKTSSARIRRHAEMNSCDSNEKVREGLEVEVVLCKLNATREELETALERACREFMSGHWEKVSYIGWDGNHSFPGDRFQIVWR